MIFLQKLELLPSLSLFSRNHRFIIWTVQIVLLINFFSPVVISISLPSKGQVNQQPDDHWSPTTVLIVSQANVNGDCTVRPSVTVNGSSPGPELRYKEGDKIWIRVINQLLDYNTTIHFHGLSQYGSPFADGTPKTAQFAIAPNGSYFDYEFQLQPGSAGSYIYHAHVGNQLSTAHGAFIVEDPQEAPFQYDDEMTLVMSDYYHATDDVIESGLKANPFKWLGDPQSLLVNGNAMASCDSTASHYGCVSSCHHHTVIVKPEMTYRVRVIGITSLTYLYFGFEDHPEIQVIEVDGGYVKRVTTSHIEIASGQRYSFLLKTKSRAELANLNGKRDFWARIQSRWRPTRVQGSFVLRYAQDTLHLDPTNIVVTPGSSPEVSQDNFNREAMPPLNELEKLVPLPAENVPWLEDVFEPLNSLERAPLASEVNRRIIVSGQQIKDASGSINWRVNGQPYDETAPTIPFLVRAYTTGIKPDYDAASQNDGFDPTLRAYPIKLGEVVEMVFLNLASTTGVAESHPWHIHGQAPYVVGHGLGAFSDEALAKQEAQRIHQPIKRDTQMIFAGQGATYTNTTVPIGTQTGWMVFRIKFEDPGAFLLHCHTQPHALMGMAVVLLIGIENLPPLPPNFLKEYITPDPPTPEEPQSYFHHDPTRGKLKSPSSL